MILSNTISRDVYQKSQFEHNIQRNKETFLDSTVLILMETVP